MSDNSGTESNTTESGAGSNPPSTQQQSVTTPPPAAQPDYSKQFEAFSTTLTALPEMIAKSVKEAIGTPAPAKSEPAEKPAEKTNTEKPAEKATEKTTEAVPGRRGWDGGKWWFS